MRVKVPLAFLLVETVLFDRALLLLLLLLLPLLAEAAARVAAAFLTLLVNMDVMRSWPLDKSVTFFDFLTATDFSVGCEDGITAGSDLTKSK